jgi:hypothetical protein
VNHRNLSGAILGLLFILSAFAPMASYRFKSEVPIVGVLRNLILPTGWFGIIAGTTVLLYKRIGLKNKGLIYAVLVISIILIILSLFQGLFLYVDYLVGLLHGVEGDFDFESRSNAVPLFLGILSIFTGILLVMIRDKPEKLYQ